MLISRTRTVLSAEQRAHQLRSLYLEARQLVEDLSRSLSGRQSPSSQINSQSSNFEPDPSQLSNALIEVCCSIDDPPAKIQSILESFKTNNTTSAVKFPKTTLDLCSKQTNIIDSLLWSILKEKNRQLQYWRRRLEFFMRMRYEFERLSKFLGQKD